MFGAFQEKRKKRTLLPSNRTHVHIQEECERRRKKKKKEKKEKKKKRKMESEIVISRVRLLLVLEVVLDGKLGRLLQDKFAWLSRLVRAKMGRGELLVSKVGGERKSVWVQRPGTDIGFLHSLESCRPWWPTVVGRHPMCGHRPIGCGVPAHEGRICHHPQLLLLHEELALLLLEGDKLPGQGSGRRGGDKCRGIGVRVARQGGNSSGHRRWRNGGRVEGRAPGVALRVRRGGGSGGRGGGGGRGRRGG